MRQEQETHKNIWDHEKLSCHFEPFANAQGRLREKSLFRPKREICLGSFAFAQTGTLRHRPKSRKDLFQIDP